MEHVNRRACPSQMPSYRVAQTKRSKCRPRARPFVLRPWYAYVVLFGRIADLSKSLHGRNTAGPHSCSTSSSSFAYVSSLRGDSHRQPNITGPGSVTLFNTLITAPWAAAIEKMGRFEEDGNVGTYAYRLPKGLASSHEKDGIRAV